MPLLTNDDYLPPNLLLRNGHLNTIASALMRPNPPLPYQRERITTPDHDFLDLDWLKGQNDQLLIGFHGLEGSTDRPYLQGLFRHFHQNGWDTLGVNFRSCSGELNRQLRLYNSGETHDPWLVIQHALQLGYQRIALAGFSLGGNIVLKLMGELGIYAPPQLVGAVAFSTPCHIPDANDALLHWENRIYLKRFMKTLVQKVVEKREQYPKHLRRLQRTPSNFPEFDGNFTGPIHGYANAEDYWNCCASLHFLPNINRPTLLISAKDDSFLRDRCYPYELADQHQHFHFLPTRYGGHCGYYGEDSNGALWSERKALAFLEKLN